MTNGINWRPNPENWRVSHFSETSSPPNYHSAPEAGFSSLNAGRKTAAPAVINSMRISLAHIGTNRAKKDAFRSLAAGYLERCGAFARCESQAFATEAALLEWLDRIAGREHPVVVLLDSTGKQMTSEAFARWFGERRDRGAQRLVFGVGPADGWSATARARAESLLSLGQLTLPHSLAQLVMAEQIYRAFTILSGHPYHTGH